MTKELPSLSIKFEGGLANNHQMNLYEISRFQYGLARLIYTVAHYSETGVVLNKINKKIDVDIRVSAPTEGSVEYLLALGVSGKFLWSFAGGAGEALGRKIGELSGDLFSAFFIYLLNRFNSRRSLDRELIEKIVALYGQLFPNEIAKDPNLEEASALIDKIAHGAEKLLVERFKQEQLIEDMQELIELNERVKGYIAYDNYIEPYIPLLDKIDIDDSKLANCFRKVSGDLAKVFDESSSCISIGVDGLERQTVYTLDRRSIESLGGETVDLIPTTIIGDIFAYNKRTGWGRLNVMMSNYPSVLPFTIPGIRKRDTLHDISSAFSQPKTGISCYVVRNRAGDPIRLVFDHIVEIND
jgi:hypothetical protein